MEENLNLGHSVTILYIEREKGRKRMDGNGSLGNSTVLQLAFPEETDANFFRKKSCLGQ